MVVVALLAATSGYFLARSMGTTETPPPATNQVPKVEDLIGRKRPDFTHENLDGDPVSASDFDGRVWLVNFWATWCKPCVDEMPMLSRLHLSDDGQGVQVVGIALDDPDRARQFARELSVRYPVLLGQADVVITGRRYGNSTGMLPFSVLVDAGGQVRWVHLGALDRDELMKQISEL